MQLYKIGYFSNFYPSDYYIIQKKLDITRDIIFDHREEINRVLSSNSFDLCVVFDNYIVDGINSDIEQILIPDSKNNNIKKFHILPDSWAFTIDGMYDKYKDKNCIFFITSECISNLEDPKPVLTSLEKIGLEKKKNILLVYSEASGYRKWSKKTLDKFLLSSGFTLNSGDGDIWHLSFSMEGYQSYLSKLDLSKNFAYSHLLFLTTEDASVKATGGIGTYINNIKIIDPTVAILICDAWVECSFSTDNTLVVKSLIQHMSVITIVNGVVLIEALRYVLYLLPNIINTEFQDYQALSFRIVQVKKQVCYLNIFGLEYSYMVG